MIIIIGAGLTGLSSSYHIGHDRCLVLEQSGQAFGHIGTDLDGGFTWDQGPHVSFTRNEYVRALFADAVDGEYEEYSVKVGNYFRGHWIDHPAQTALHQVPQPLRQQCLDSFLTMQSSAGHAVVQAAPTNYMQWLEQAFGSAFANTFPASYTRKYWTVDATELGCDWVGQRIQRPSVQDVIEGSCGPLNRTTHYIDKVRYPKKGGYQSFAKKLAEGCNIRYGAEVGCVDLKSKIVTLATGEKLEYTHLVNTMALPLFVRACRNVPTAVLDAAFELSCSQLLLVEVSAQHATMRPENWIYVYDEDKLATRLNFTEKLSSENVPSGWTGVQTEVYFSKHKPLIDSPTSVGTTVLNELVCMGLLAETVPEALARGLGRMRTRYVPWANVIYHHQTRAALGTIWNWLETQGLERTSDDTHPLTDWSMIEKEPPLPQRQHHSLFMGGRFGQWKYFWSDDCVLRGRQLALSLGQGVEHTVRASAI